MANKVFQIVRPRSLTDENYSDFEYLIRWIGRDGSDYVYMFENAEFDIRVKNSIINETDKARIQAVNIEEARTIKLTANDLSKNDLLVIAEIFQNKFVTRIRKDGTVERYAPDANSYRWELLDGRYEVSFSLRMHEVSLWK